MIQSRMSIWQRLAYFAGYSIIFLIFTLLISLLLFILMESFLSVGLADADLSLEIGALNREFSVLLIAVLSSIGLLAVITRRRTLAAWGFSTHQLRPAILLGSFLAILLLITFFVLLWAGGWLEIKGTDWQGNLLFWWFVFFLIQPLMEELMMRSFLQNMLHHIFGNYVGLFGSAVVFSLLHYSNDYFSWISALQIFGGGLLMGLLFLKYQSIWAAFAFHSCWNFVQSILLGFSVSGMETYRLIQPSINGPTWLTGGDFGVEGSLVSFLMIVVAIVYFWPAAKNNLPFPASNEIQPNLLDHENESHIA